MKLDENSFSRNSFISLPPSDDSLLTIADFPKDLSRVSFPMIATSNSKVEDEIPVGRWRRTRRQKASNCDSNPGRSLTRFPRQIAISALFGCTGVVMTLYMIKWLACTALRAANHHFGTQPLPRPMGDELAPWDNTIGINNTANGVLRSQATTPITTRHNRFSSAPPLSF
jgi:hypothetical protein